MVNFRNPAATPATDWGELLGRLLIIYPTRVEENISTSLGPKDAIVADLHIADGDHPESRGEVFVWPKVLQAQLRPLIGTGEPCLGRLTQGVAKPGQSAPWKLSAATEADIQIATKYLESNDVAPF
jgi:hypothetical protein